MSDRRVYAIYVNHPADHLTTGDYHQMYIVAESPQAARNWAHDKATNDGCRANVFQDEFAATCVIFDEQVPAGEPIGIRSVEVWNGPTCQRRDCKSPRSCTHPIESKQDFVTTVAAEAAPIAVPLWNVEGQNPAHVTLMRVDTTRTATRSLVHWIFENGTERTFDFGEQIAVKFAKPEPVPVKATRTCKFCDLDVEYETDRWVSAAVGGTYDRCTVNTGDPTEYPTAGHRPA